MQNNKQYGFRGVAAAGVFALAVVLTGCSGGSETTGAQAGSGTPGAGTGASSAAGSGTGSGMMPGSGMGGSGGGMMGGPGQSPGGAPGAKAVANNPGGPAPEHRVDPFKPWWPAPPPPSVLTFTRPVRIAMGGSGRVEIQPNIEVHEVPTRRVAGILSGNGVYALIEGNGEMNVVKPGDLVGDYRVDSINSDSVILKKTVKFGKNTQIYTQVVPLTDVGSSVTQFSGPAMGGVRPGMGAPVPGPGVGRPGIGKGGTGAD